MTQWYYSDYERNRLGPVAASDLADLHRAGQLQPDTLVWREGMANWRAWREVMQIALAEAEGRTHPSQEAAPLSSGVNPYAMAEAATSKSPDAEAKPISAGVDPYEVVTPRAYGNDPSTPYAPPRATLGRDQYDYVRGGEVVYAGFLKRLAAMTIDGFVMMAVYFVLVMVFMLVGVAGVGLGSAFRPDSLASTGLGIGLILVMYVLPIIAQFAYFTWMHASSYQATLGKMAVGIKVVDADGARIGTGRALGRYAGFFFFTLLSCYLAAIVSAFTSGLTDRKQALHDMAASTLVVDRWAYTHHPERQNRDLGVVTIIVVSLLGLGLLAYLLMVLFAIASGLGS
jgi:uncharacterized RDD family membrane protein YckC